MRSFFTDNKKFDNPFFIGTVEDNNDPTFNYRIKVRIHHLHPQSITTAQLPWAARVDTAFMGIGSERVDHKIPEVGTQVLCIIVGNDVNSLLYIGCLYKNTTNTPQDNKYLDTYGVYASNGQFIGIDKIQKFFNMLFEGTINIDKVLNVNANVKDSVNLQCTNLQIKDTNTNITGTTYTLKENTINTSTETETKTSKNTSMNIQTALNIDSGLSISLKAGALTTITSPTTNIKGVLNVSTGASGVVFAGAQTMTIANGIVVNIS